MIISLGYRVKSIIATKFRIWATERILKVLNPFVFLRLYKINFILLHMGILLQK